MQIGKIISSIGIMALLMVTGVQAQDASLGEDAQVMRGGVALGIWNTIGVSVNVEKIMDRVVLEDFMINGTWGVGAELGYERHKVEYNWFGSPYGWKYTYIPVFVFASYHHILENPKYDPFVKLGLGYVYVKATEFGTYSSGLNSHDSYIDLVSQIGVRYKINEKMALVGTLGHPWTAGLGIDITL